MRKIILGACGVALTLASSANAATVRFKQYTDETDKQFRVFNRMYLDGVKEGLIAFNSALVADGKSPLFCLPPKLALTVEQADNIMMREAKVFTDPDNFPISILLLNGLEATFPCNK
jgi:hypothetical protein